MDELNQDDKMETQQKGKTGVLIALKVLKDFPLVVFCLV